MIGTGAGIGIAWCIGGPSEHYTMTMIAFLGCSLGSMTATYLSIRDVTITALSLPRLEVLLGDYFNVSTACDWQQILSELECTSHVEHRFHKALLTPKQLREQEYLLGAPVPTALPPLLIGCDLDKVFGSREEFQVTL